MREKRSKRYQIIRFISFFLSMAFVITCNFFLFFHFMKLNTDDVRRAAPITFGNVIFLSFLFCVVDQIQRYYTVTRPVRKIQKGIARVMQGDFTTEIPYSNSLSGSQDYDEIIEGLNRMIEELNSVETLRTDFIANVSHEIKTPLSVMQNYGTLLQQKNLSEEERLEYAGKLTEQTRKLSALITNILKLNKLENQQIFPQMERYDLSEQLCECMLMFESAWEEKELNIETDIEDNVMVTGDSEMLSIVWNNLLSNAVKFTEKGGTIGLKVYSKGKCAVVSISDTGCGMNEETGRNIFNKFYQGDTSHAMSGNGLGLALAKRIIDIHQGEIRVESRLGMGSTFKVKIDNNEEL